MSDYAFPHNPSEVNGNTTGMTLRDYFAAKAMQAHYGALSMYSLDKNVHATDDALQFLALNSYLMADAMIKAREA